MTCSAAPARRSEGLLTTLLAGCAVAMIAIEFIAAGLLPVLARAMAMPVAQAGLFVTIFALAAGVLGPPLSLWAARLPPRPVLVAVLLVYGLGNLGAVVLASPEALLLARLAQGAALPVFVSIANTEIAAIVGEGRSGRAIAQINVGVIVGLVAAMPAGVALAGGADWRSPFAALGFLALVMAGLLALIFPSGRASRPVRMTEQIGILREPAFLGHLLLSVAIFTAMFCAYTFLAAFLDVVVDLDGRSTALLLMGFGAIGLAGNDLAGRLVERWPLAATAGAILLLVPATLAFSLAGANLGPLLAALALWGLAQGAMFVLCQVRVMRAGGVAPAFASALNIAACNLGIALGASFGGLVVECFGLAAIGFGAAGLAIMALAVTAVTARLGRSTARG